MLLYLALTFIGLSYQQAHVPENKYETCSTKLDRADKHTCGGNKEPTGSCHETDETCPAGSSCIKGGLGVGLCCEDANEKEWEKETNPTCDVGDVLMRNTWYGSEVWLGKSCGHRFCPYGYDCIQGQRVAHCCGPIPNYEEKFYPEDDNTIGDMEGGYSPLPPAPPGSSSYTKPPVQTMGKQESGYRHRRY
ncbi:unnamed protein product [Nippostrongylus brasiliensis]|uniref:Secreted protein n=1 Tax=Nippostrongylus brasiliensis TaxID=27835 RepID=A0A0N4XC98_NIPBR|nr:unnamed protein product [Nippostrongylus brasiliensis]